MPTHWVFENDEGNWSLVDEEMEKYLEGPRRFVIGPGINTAELFPVSAPIYGIVSHSDAGMGGDRRWLQYNLQTHKPRLLSCIGWESATDLDRILKDGSMINSWKECLKSWQSHDLELLQRPF